MQRSVITSAAMAVSASALALTGTPAPARAAPTVPKVCGAYVTLPDGEAASVHATGKVKSITPQKEPTLHDIVIAGAKGDQKFTLSLTPPSLPFKVGDALDVSLRRGGGWHRVYDALIKDAAGKVLIIVSGSGADDWADGWKVTTGKVVQSEQNPNTKQLSVQRTHALDFARGKTRVTVSPDGCTLVQDGADRYAASGAGHTWLGEREPEGVDYQRFAMVRL